MHGLPRQRGHSDLPPAGLCEQASCHAPLTTVKPSTACMRRARPELMRRAPPKAETPKSGEDPAPPPKEAAERLVEAVRAARGKVLTDLKSDGGAEQALYDQLQAQLL